MPVEYNTTSLRMWDKNAIYFDDYISAIDNFNNIIRVKPPFVGAFISKLGQIESG